MSANAPEIWHDGGRTYQLVSPKLVTYPRFEVQKIDGRNVTVRLPPLQFTVVTAREIKT